MKGRAFLVYGAEGSGTRLMRRILICAGCGGSGQLEQYFDWMGLPPVGENPLIVWGHSVPGHKPRDWPPFDRHFQLCLAYGYQVSAIVMVRDWFAMAQSQVAHDHTHAENLPDAYETMARAYKQLFAALDKHNIDYLIMPYEALVLRPRAVVARLLDHLGLELQYQFEDIYDGDARYYPEEDAELVGVLDATDPIVESDGRKRRGNGK